MIPRAHRTGIDGERDGALLVRLSAPPVDQAANDQLVEVLARALDVTARQVRVAGGARARRKRILIQGMTAADARDRVARALQRPDRG